MTGRQQAEGYRLSQNRRKKLKVRFGWFRKSPGWRGVGWRAGGN